MHKILIVEDEEAILQGLKDNLEFKGYDVSVAMDGEEGLQMITESEFQLVILDIMLPKMSGFEVCKSVRKQGIETPIIMLTARGEEMDKVLGLELGADDYITKPFSLLELLARVKTIIRRTTKVVSANESEIVEYTIGDLTVNFDAYSAFKDSEEIKMTKKEFKILKQLILNPNKIVTRDDLLEKVWEDNYQPTIRSIDNFILKLRQKIEDDVNNPKYIQTVHGVGYKLVVD